MPPVVSGSPADLEAVSKPSAALARPVLVVDLDGTLTPTDTLAESVVALLRQRPALVLALLWWLLRGRAALKAQVAARLRLDVQRLPWRADFLAWLRAERASGRRLVLATAAHQQIAQDVAQRLGLFDQVLASDAGRNLKGAAKLQAIRQQLGSDFVYAGDSRADLPVWAGAQAAVLVAAAPAVARRAHAQGRVEREFPAAPGGLRLWLRALRVHQWVKNVLLFVPLFLSFSFYDPRLLGLVVLAFLSFSLTASATYLLNDLWDLDSDRQHPRKCQRPLASGALPIAHALLAVAALLGLGMGLAAWASPAFGLMLLGYLALTLCYSAWLKRQVLLDVLVLAFLYTYRVLAGAVVIALPVKPYLLAFCVFTFLSLALVKRCAELVALAERGQVDAKGRDYRVGDLVVLWPLGLGASLCAVVVFGLFIGTPDAQAAYGDTSFLWLSGMVLVYWLGRLWIKTARGEMDDDPIVFAFRDPGSRWAVLAMALVPLTLHLAR